MGLRYSSVGPVFGAVVLVLMLMSSVAAAQNGASDDRVSLPEGPGSLEGVGENVEVNPNMGSMSYGVTVSLPAGFPGMVPNASLSYSSSAGSGVVGIGWSMEMPCIERMTYRGLPEYDRDDDFAVDGSAQLVRLPGTNPPVYRSRYESGFARYTWLDAGDGTEGYWKAEWPDGSVGYFGADAQGNLVDNARQPGADGTFRYHLVEKVDVHDHRLVYTYIKDGVVSLISTIGWAFTDGNNPTYEVRLDYEERLDDTGLEYLSDAKSGLEELLTRRLRQINIFARRIRIRHFALSYFPYDQSGGSTRLARVEQFGISGGRFPVVFDFAYQQGLGGGCEGDDCEQPFMVDMGSIGVGLGARQATLIDINGDALPDIVDSSQDGPHRIFINEALADGTSRFNPNFVSSRVGNRSGHDLQAPVVQVLDANGDGFTDLINAATGDVLVNKGGGDWDQGESASGTAELAEALTGDFDAEDGELQSLRFLDYDNDKKIDLVRSTLETTTVFRNLGAEGFVVDEDVEPIGAGFAENEIQFADMNGDALLDVVRVQAGSVQYKLNHGWGTWGDWVVIDGLPIGEGQIELVELEDINGDGLADLVVVQGDSVTYALNTNSAAFAQAIQLDSNDVVGAIPVRDNNVTVLYADMNANGSSDVVWIDAQGNAQYLELFPVRPNLLSRITNGLGQVADISYTTSAAQMALDGGWESWRYKLPFPNQVVASLDQYDLLTNVHDETTYRYHDGYYDGVEKQFRGFEHVEVGGEGDEFQEQGLVEMFYEVGFEDIYRKNLLLRQITSSAGRVLNEVENTYEDCPVAEVPQGTEFPVRYICQTQTKRIIKEGLGMDRWVTTLSRSEYDGYGNVTLSSELGVVGPGDGGVNACAPCPGRPEGEFGAACGATCTGDEAFTRTEYVVPGADTNGRWILNAAFRTRTFGREGSELVTEELSYYDGQPFQGLPLGQLDKGLTTRATVKVEVGDDRVINKSRRRYDEDGNLVESLDPLGSPDSLDHRSLTHYDDDGLRPVRQEILMADPEGQPYKLVQEFIYDDRFDKLVEGTQWMVEVGGQIRSLRREQLYRLDEFGRMTGRVMPGGDTLERPTDEYEYDLGNPTSRIIARRRSQVGGELDIEVIRCLDGRGRDFQTRERLAEGVYQVSGFTIFNLQSKPLRQYQPYLSTSAQCDLAPPEGTRFIQHRYDASFRPVSMTMPDADIYGTASVMTSVYEPLRVITHDAESNDPDSAHFNTPSAEVSNGLGWKVAIERLLEANGEPIVTQMHYDELGRIVAYTDSEQNHKSQTYDLLGRVLEIVDPNAGGTTSYEYDDASNNFRIMDARGVITRRTHDGLNRLVDEWDEADRDGTVTSRAYDLSGDCGVEVCSNAEYLISGITTPGPDGERITSLFGYNHRAKKVYEARQYGETLLETFMEYDNADRLISVTYPDGTVVENELDDQGRVVSIPGFINTIEYDERGLQVGIEHANGVTNAVGFDGLMRLDQMATTAANGAVLRSMGYARDRVGHLLSVEDQGPAVAGFPTAGVQYKYDAWYRLTEAAMSQGGEGQETVSYTYDTIQNIESRTSSLGDDSPVHTGTHRYSPDRPNAVVEVAGINRAYDLSGNTTTRGAMALTWDFRGRIAQRDNDGRITQNFYDHEQARLARTHDGSTSLYHSSDFIVRDGISELYVMVDGVRVTRVESDALATTLLTDHNGDGAINAADALLADAQGQDSEGALWSSVRRLLLESGPADGVTHLHVDHLGSLTLATAQGQGESQAIGRRAYYPFGAVRAQVGFVDDFGFTGNEHEPDAPELLYALNRTYDAASGRWLSIDPAFALISAEGVTSEGTLAYAYVTNDPINAIDRSGLEKVAMFVAFSDTLIDSSATTFDGYIGTAHTHFSSEKAYTVKTSTSTSTGTLSGHTFAPNDWGTPSTLTLVGHSGRGMFGSGGSDYLSPSQLVDKLITEGLTPGDKGGMMIELHGCTTATKTASSAGIGKRSYAKEFARQLKAKGFFNLKVTGYHGFLDGHGTMGKTYEIDSAPGGGSGTPDSHTPLFEDGAKTVYKVHKGSITGRVKVTRTEGPKSSRISTSKKGTKTIMKVVPH